MFVIQLLGKFFLLPFLRFFYSVFGFFTFRKIKHISTISKFKKEQNRLFILGNGPSLNKSIEKYRKILSCSECIAVNHFCETQYFEELKPSIYVVADPNCHIIDINTLSEYYRKILIKMVSALKTKTKWKLRMIIPDFGMNGFLYQNLKDVSNISFLFYNTFSFSFFDETYGFSVLEKKIIKNWDKNLISLPAQTVLNTSLSLGIYWRYKEIYLMGADTSWVELLRVDQENNMLYTEDTHFYGVIKKPLYADVNGKIPEKMHKELRSISNAFYLYWQLKRYADSVGVSVFNASEYSLIDAFPRKKPEE